MKQNPDNKRMQTAFFGGGCFWCLEAVFAKLKGIKCVTSGYAGGTKEEPTYEEVCSGKTGHAEVAKVEYDPTVISYHDLLSVFFAIHYPTTLDRQGADAGTQYRSIVLFASEDQKKEAQNFIEKLGTDKIFEMPVVTELKKFEKFYPAEDYHQKYFENNTFKPYCQINISPKIAKLRDRFKDLVK